MSRRRAALLFAALALPLCSSFAAERKPNIVVFFIDDLGWADLGCYGSEFHLTPNVDALAGRGMRFTDGYAACPVCSPARRRPLSRRTKRSPSC